jgi:serine/threonine protein kinase
MAAFILLADDMQPLKNPIEFETTFATYTATAIIGQGGAGRVYAAQDDEGTKVALKLLNTETASKDKRKRFKNELAFLRKTTHPHLVQVLDHGLSAAKGAIGPFYVMPRYEGSLRDMLQAGIPPSDVANVFGQLLNGVEAAHLLGAVHRDLKPENVLFRRSNGKLVLAVADFGVASFQPENQATLVETAMSTRLANFMYAAPEQRRPGQQAGIPADIFALGLILNEMFTNEVPHGAGYKRIGDVQPDFSYLDAIVDAMTQQNPQSRLASIETVKQRLRLDHEQAMLKQRLSIEPSNVVIDTEVDDPLVTDPVRIVGVDWNNHTLRITLSKPVNSDWIHAMNNMGGHTAVWGAGPENFNFAENVASVSTGAHSAQNVIDHFKNWIPVATRVYRSNIIRKREEAARREMEELKRQRKQDEERLNVVSRLTF